MKAVGNEPTGLREIEECACERVCVRVCDLRIESVYERVHESRRICAGVCVRESV